MDRLLKPEDRDIETTNLNPAAEVTAIIGRAKSTFLAPSAEKRFKRLARAINSREINTNKVSRHAVKIDKIEANNSIIVFLGHQ